MELRDSVTVITGGAQGLGAALAREIRAKGGTLIIADLSAEALHPLAAELGADAVECDVRQESQVKRLAESAVERYGRIDLWVNNAGVWMPYAPVEAIDTERAHLLMEVNYFGLAYGSIEAKRHMAPRGSGAILNILSVRALAGHPEAAAYCASKFAAEGFTQSLRAELHASGVHVLSVYPYRMKTELFGDSKHEDYETSMEPGAVARIIVANLAEDIPAEHLEIWSPEDVRTGA